MRTTPIAIVALTMALLPTTANAGPLDELTGIELPADGLSYTTCLLQQGGGDDACGPCEPSDNTLSVMHDNNNYGGDCVLSYSESAQISCSSHYYYVRQTSMEDKANSAYVTGVGGCNAMTVFTNINFGGLRETCDDSCSELSGSLKNEVSSYTICKLTGSQTECPWPSI